MTVEALMSSEPSHLATRTATLSPEDDAGRSPWDRSESEVGRTHDRDIAMPHRRTDPMNPLLIGRILGVAIGLLIQVLVVAPALGPSMFTIVTFIALIVGGLVAGDLVARWLVRGRGESGTGPSG